MDFWCGLDWKKKWKLRGNRLFFRRIKLRVQKFRMPIRVNFVGLLFILWSLLFSLWSLIFGLLCEPIILKGLKCRWVYYLVCGIFYYFLTWLLILSIPKHYLFTNLSGCFCGLSLDILLEAKSLMYSVGELFFVFSKWFTFLNLYFCDVFTSNWGHFVYRIINSGFVALFVVAVPYYARVQIRRRVFI
jgi:hypothetical protein